MRSEEGVEDTGVSWAPSGRLEPGLGIQTPSSLIYVTLACSACTHPSLFSAFLTCMGLSKHTSSLLLQEMLLLTGDSPLTRACELRGSVAAALRILSASLDYGLILEGILGLCTCSPTA